MFLIAKNYKGIDKYLFAVVEYILWLENNLLYDFNEITPTTFPDYFSYLINRPNKRRKGFLSESSIKNHLFAISLLNKFLLQSGKVESIFRLPSFHVKNRQSKEVISREEIKTILNSCDNLLERCIILTGYGCGLRRNEMVMLNIDDILISKGILIVREGKNTKRREIPLSDSILFDFKEYITKERPSLLKQNRLEKAFFISHNGMRRDGGNLNTQLKRIISRTKNVPLQEKNITLHNLRHSIATHLMENGAGFENVRDFLGHIEINTTHLYAIRRKRNKIFQI